jgi:hypothetical protein
MQAFVYYGVMGHFDEQLWREAARHEDWYVRIRDEYQALYKRAGENSDEAESIKEAVRSFLEKLLVNGELSLGGPDPRLDVERQTIRQAVIHHSKRPPGYYSLERLNAVHLLNLYLPHYADGRPVSSNHYRDGKMVFYGYHWWVKADGSVTRLLPDEAIGWQAGNWAVNCSSVGICINDDLTNKEPSEAALEAVGSILRNEYGRLPALEVLGHREVNPKTACPDERFLAGWKGRLVAKWQAR